MFKFKRLSCLCGPGGRGGGFLLTFKSASDCKIEIYNKNLATVSNDGSPQGAFQYHVTHSNS